LYKPLDIVVGDLFPAVVLNHGISGAKEMMNGIDLELAKNGFVAVSIDLMVAFWSRSCWTCCRKEMVIQKRSR
jgi:dienelactone hydrolase